MPTSIPIRSRLLPFVAAATLLALALTAAGAQGAQYRRGEVVVGYQHLGAHAASAAPIVPQVVKLPRGESVSRVAARLRRRPGVAYAVPNFIAHASDFAPNDPGRSRIARGWMRLQWNFLAPAGVDAPGAWGHVNAVGHPGGRGVRIALLDTGVAYRDLGRFRRSPDFDPTHFVAPYDFVDHDRLPVDRNSHGTHVAGTLSEATDNGLGVTGLAYGATLMPVRVLDRNGDGDAATIAKGIRYAVNHGARVINMSLEFSSEVSAAEIPDILGALGYAHRRGVVVVAASGNESTPRVAYPARAGSVISVGATTEHQCLAFYSNDGSGLDLVAPGGGGDANLPGDLNCRPFDRDGRSIVQETFTSSVGRFSLVSMDGTSMATPHVAATAALVIASGVLGRRPRPDAIVRRLEQTARDLGPLGRDDHYGYGLVDAAAATAPLR